MLYFFFFLGVVPAFPRRNPPRRRPGTEHSSPPSPRLAGRPCVSNFINKYIKMIAVAAQQTASDAAAVVDLGRFLREGEPSSPEEERGGKIVPRCVCEFPPSFPPPHPRGSQECWLVAVLPRAQSRQNLTVKQMDGAKCAALEPRYRPHRCGRGLILSLAGVFALGTVDCGSVWKIWRFSRAFGAKNNRGWMLFKLKWKRMWRAEHVNAFGRTWEHFLVVNRTA